MRYSIDSHMLYNIYHETFQLCAKDRYSDASYFFTIDRIGSNGDITELRLSAVGKGKGCLEENHKWIHRIGAKVFRNYHFFKIKEDIDYSLKDLTMMLPLFLQTYPEYNGLKKNCQHFATGFLNIMTGKNKSQSNGVYSEIKPFRRALLKMKYEKHNADFLSRK